jgi:hypothetical protein
VYNRARGIDVAATDEPLSITTSEAAKPRAFAASELVPCAQCSRSNPPTRANCLYCGAPLALTEPKPFETAAAPVNETASDSLFHVVGLPRADNADDAALAEVAERVNLTLSDAGTLTNQAFGAPLLTAKSKSLAELVSEQLRRLGVATALISDDEISVTTPPREISGLQFNDESLTAIVRRSGERLSQSWVDVSLVVVGRLYFATTETELKSNRRKDLIDERELTSDEAVLDLYTRNDKAGWRIRAASFDFSCLGDEKKLTVFENFDVLIRRLRERGNNAVFDDSYMRIRSVLNKVWPIELRSGANEKRRTAFSGGIDSSSMVSDNESQFTRYSRLLRHLQAS